MTWLKPLLTSCVVIITVATLWFDFHYLNEAYGAGPPYFSRSTNMDKWTSPWPALVVVNALSASVIYLCVRKIIKLK